ncbi:LysE family translocator [Marinomonas epiphytica]
MTFSMLLSMALFSLVASISPGPVNLLSLSSSARYGVATGLRFVTGSSFGFIVLFLLIGFGLGRVLDQFPWMVMALKWAGAAFLLWLSIQLLKDKGQLTLTDHQQAPSFMTGVIMQWLNPKAWLASVSGIAAYTNQAEPIEIVVFASLYLPICWLSLSVWVWAGVMLGKRLNSPAKIRLMNRSLAVLLLFSCGLIIA